MTIDDTVTLVNEVEALGEGEPPTEYILQRGTVGTIINLSDAFEERIYMVEVTLEDGESLILVTVESNLELQLKGE